MSFQIVDANFPARNALIQNFLTVNFNAAGIWPYEPVQAFHQNRFTTPRCTNYYKRSCGSTVRLMPFKTLFESNDFVTRVSSILGIAAMFILQKDRRNNVIGDQDQN